MFRPVARFRPPLSLADAAAFLRAHLPPGGPDPGVFERAFASRVLGAGHHAVLAPSGRVALYWILRALGVSDGDEVVTQAFNFPAVLAAVQATGARPVLADLRPGAFDLDPAAAEAALTPHTRAVVVTHLYGNPAPLDPFVDLCRRRGLILVEDCAQAVGATHRGAPVGTFGRAALLTFGPTKTFTLLGGGAVVTGDPDLAAAVRELAARNPVLAPVPTWRLALKAAVISAATHPELFSAATFPAIRLLGASGDDPVHRVMDEPDQPLSAPERAPLPAPPMRAVGLTQLEGFEALNQARRHNGTYLHRALADTPGLTLPPSSPGNIFVSFPVLHPRRHALAAELRRLGVDTDAGFMADCAALPRFGAAPCPNSARAAREVLHLPVHPDITRGQLHRMVAAVRTACRRG